MNHHASEEVRDEFIICRIQKQYALKLTMFLCLCVERDVETPDKSKAEPKVVVSVGPVIMTDPKREPAENVELKKIPENI